MLKWLLLLLACLQGQTAPPSPTPQVPEVDCPTCKGKGRAEQDCIECNWQRTRPCARCLPNAELDRMLELTTQLDDRPDFTPAQSDARNALGLKLDALHMEFQSVKDLRTRVDSRSGRKYVAGRAPCPAKGMTGSELFEKSKGCKYCADADSFPCPECAQTGRRPCGECAGPKHAPRVCDDCNGTKTLPMPTLPASVCGWCGDVGGRACGQCDAKGKVLTACRTCAGSKVVVCTACLGSKSKPCPECKGRGIARVDNGTGASFVNCNGCKQTGKVSCDVCKKKQTTVCPDCKGAGKLEQICPRCAGSHIARCTGCTQGGYRYWDVAAELLAAAGKRDAALDHLHIAMSRMEKVFEQRTRELALANASVLGLEKFHAAERKRFAERETVLKAEGH